MSTRERLKSFEIKLQELEQKKAFIEGQIATVKEMIGDLKGEPAKKTRITGRSSSVKSTVLGILEEYGVNGMNAADVVEVALRDKGERLDRGSVSSLLSRLKNSGVADYDGKRYRLKSHDQRFRNPDETKTENAVVPLRTSGQTPRG